MQISREVIVDLLPAYLSGEASPATCALVEEFFRSDPEIAERVRDQWGEGLRPASPGLSPELELRSLKQTRRLLTWQKWLFGIALASSAVGLSLNIQMHNGRIRDAHFLFQSNPAFFGTALALGVVFWIVYFTLRRHVRGAGF